VSVPRTRADVKDHRLRGITQNPALLTSLTPKARVAIIISYHLPSKNRTKEQRFGNGR